LNDATSSLTEKFFERPARRRRDFAFGFVEVSPKRRKLRRRRESGNEAGILSTNSDQGQARLADLAHVPPATGKLSPGNQNWKLGTGNW
jgi:hypothetical protein